MRQTYREGSQQLGHQAIDEGPAWGDNPRLYVVLRNMGKLELLGEMVNDGICDYYFPFPAHLIPDYTGLSATDFYKTQEIVLTSITALERGRHRNLDWDVVMPFENKVEIGKGTYGVVQRVSYFAQTFARKLISRRSEPSMQKENMNSFKKEVEALKRLDHRHIVKLKGSYTGSLHAVFLMTPAADCNLAQYFVQIQKSIGQEAVERRSILRSFFGCLTDALKHIHQSQIRHKDIKPKNILVYGREVLFADFGTSRDWSGMSRSATTGPAAMGTPEYKAPEVAQCKSRTSASDIWSLGCIFLEMVTVLKCETVEALKSFMKAESGSPLYWCNLTAIAQWIEKLYGKAPGTDSMPLEWVWKMLHEEPERRCKAEELKGDIVDRNSSSNSPLRFCGSCCGGEGEEWVVVERTEVAETDTGREILGGSCGG